MKRFIVFILMILLSIGVFSCLNPEIDNTEEYSIVKIFSKLPYITKSEQEPTELVINGSTQIIEWMVLNEFRIVNIYIMIKGEYHSTVITDYDNSIGYYEWIVPEDLEKEHGYQIMVYPHNGEIDNINPEELPGYLTEEFSSYYSAINNAEFLIEDIHQDVSDETKELLYISYIDTLLREGIDFMGRDIPSDPINDTEQSDLIQYIMDKMDDFWNDTDGDGIPDHIDSDMDGDGTNNDEDSDIDGDGTNNDEDDTPYGDGFNFEGFFGSLSYLDLYYSNIVNMIKDLLYLYCGIESWWEDDNILRFEDHRTGSNVKIVYSFQQSDLGFPNIDIYIDDVINDKKYIIIFSVFVWNNQLNVTKYSGYGVGNLIGIWTYTIYEDGDI